MKQSFTADWPLLVQHVVATTRGKQHVQYLHLVESAEDRTRKPTTPACSPGAAPGELLDVPTLASVAWYFCFQMWLSMHSVPVTGFACVSPLHVHR
jgi:hypothetical protein